MAKDKRKILFRRIFLLSLAAIFYLGLNLSNLNASDIKNRCITAIQMFEPKWDYQTGASTIAVSEAKSLGFTERECARLTERFSEQQLRKASNKGAIKKGKRQDLIRTTNVDITSSLNKIKSLERLNKELRQEFSLQKSRITFLEQKNKKADIKQSKKLEDLTQLVSALKLSIKSKEESNINIQEGNATIKAINTSLQRIKNENQELQKKNEKLLKTIADWQDVIQRLKRNQESSSKPQNQNTEKSKKTSVLNEANTPPVQEEDLPDYMIWSIPVLLIIGAFGIILVVLIRRNNKNREELEKSLRNSRRSLSPEKPKSEVLNNTPDAGESG